MQLHVAIDGGGSRDIVFLHGFGGHHSIWHGIVHKLGLPARSFAYDLPGHGDSLNAPGAGSAKATADALLADFSQRGVKRAHIVGHSMGGAVAVLIALAAPGMVGSLTLLAPGGFGAEINGPLLRRFAQAVEPEEVCACLAAMSAPGAVVPDDVVQALSSARARPGQRQRLIDIAARITRDDRQGVIPRHSLAGLTMPVAVAWGTRDPVLPFAQCADLPPNVRLHRVQGAGHMLVEEAPDDVVALVRVGLDAG